jgi:hypothetical protein
MAVIALCVRMTWRGRVILKLLTLAYMFYGLEGWEDDGTVGMLQTWSIRRDRLMLCLVRMMRGR